MILSEKELTEDLLEKMMLLSRDWEAERSCWGYRANQRDDIEGNRIFTAEESGEIIAYLFGHHMLSSHSSSIMPEGTACFEVEELYVIPSQRGRGVGTQLFRYAEKQVGSAAEYLMLSTATKNYRAILHFYIEECGMNFWNARLFKKISAESEENG